jgi:hypothetical protein
MDTTTITLPHTAALPHTVTHCCTHCNTLSLALSHTASLGTLSSTLVPVSSYFGYQALSARVSVSVFAPRVFHVNFMGFRGILHNLRGFLEIFGDFWGFYPDNHVRDFVQGRSHGDWARMARSTGTLGSDRTVHGYVQGSDRTVHGD